MDFQRARTDAQIANRQEEIVNACDAIFSSGDFDAVTIKAISEMTSINRSSIYTYYKTREEIVLDLLKREYLIWHQEMEEKFNSTEKMTKEEYCHFITFSLVNRIKMLKLLSIHLTAIENNCSLEKLAEFKRDCSVVFEVFAFGLEKYFPEASAETKDMFVCTFFPFIYGLYPTTHPTQKQIDAMKIANIQAMSKSFEELCYEGMLIMVTIL